MPRFRPAASRISSRTRIPARANTAMPRPAPGRWRTSSERSSSRAQLDMLHVPYRGGGPAVTDLMGGQIAMYFGNSADLLPHATNDAIRIIGVSTPRRMRQLPHVPTVNEVLPGFEMTAWQGFLAPAGTPSAIVDLLAREIQNIIREP